MKNKLNDIIKNVMMTSDKYTSKYLEDDFISINKAAEKKG